MDTEMLLTVLTLVFVVAGGGLAIWLLRRSTEKADAARGAAYQARAEMHRVPLDWEEKDGRRTPRFEFVHREQKIAFRIDHGFRPRSEGGNGYNHTALEAELGEAAPAPFRLTVEPPGAVVRKVLGFQDIQVGTAKFDQAFCLKGDDEASVRAVFTAEVQDAILGLHERVTAALNSEGFMIAKGTATIEIRCGEGKLSIRRTGDPRTSESLAEFEEGALSVLDVFLDR